MNAALEAVELDHRIELAKLKMQLVLYRKTLLEHGIVPPDKSGEDLLEMWENCRGVINAAHVCLMELGSAKEMLANWP